MNNCQIINFTERKREREHQAARAPLHPLLWPALITASVLCWGVVAVDGHPFRSNHQRGPAAPLKRSRLLRIPTV